MLLIKDRGKSDLAALAGSLLALSSTLDVVTLIGKEKPLCRIYFIYF